MEIAAPVDRARLARRRALARSRGRRRLALVCAVAGLAVAAGGYKLLEASSVFAVRDVTVQGGTPGLDAQVEAAMRAAVGSRSLLTVDTGPLERTLLAMPYVRRATVDRAFPNTLAVSVAMEHPKLAARVGSRYTLVAADGRALTTTAHPPAGLPVVSLPPGTTLGVGTVAGDANLRAGEQVLGSAPWQFRRPSSRITKVIPRAGVVTAVVAHRLQIRLGTPDMLALKLRVAARVLARVPAGQRAALSYIDVSAPSRAALGFRSHP